MIDMSRKKFLITSIVLFILTMLISSIGIANTHNWGGDFSQYISQARAIVEGNVNEWYIRNSFSIDHSADGIGAHAYPWLTSILIAPIYAIWGINYVPYQVFMSFCFAISVAVLFSLLIGRNIEYNIALLICSLVIINSNFLYLTKSVLSDIPCFMFTVVSWVLIDKYVKTRTVQYAVLVGILAFAAFSTRTMALALIAALGIVDLIYVIRNYRRLSVSRFLILCLPYCSFLILYFIMSAVLPRGGTTYLGYFSLDVKHIFSNAYYYCKKIIVLVIQVTKGFHWLPEQFNNHFRSVLLVLIVILMVPLAALSLQGFINRLKQCDHLSVYFIVMFLMLCIYNYLDIRFIISLFPIILLCAYYGIMSARAHINKEQFVFSKSGKKLWRERLLRICIDDCCIIMAVSVVIGGYRIASGDTGSVEKENAANSEEALAVYSYINDHLDKDNVVLFFKPRVLYLYTGVLSYTNDTELPETINDADYLLNYTGDQRFNDYINDHEDFLSLKFENEKFNLYEIDKLSGGEELNKQIR